MLLARRTMRIIFTLLVARTLYISHGALIYSTRMNIARGKSMHAPVYERERMEKAGVGGVRERKGKARVRTLAKALCLSRGLAGFMKSAAFIVLRRGALCFVPDSLTRAPALSQLRNYSPGL